MKLFVGLSAAISLTVLLAACSSSSPPSDDAGANDGSADGAGGCTAVAPSAANVPKFTAPAVGQGVCGSADITAFAAACGAGATGATPVTACQAWLQSMSTAGCRQCLLGTNNTIGVFDSVTFAGQSTIIPSLGACILGTAGSATPTACPAAAEPLEYCADDACAQCTGAGAAACVKSSETGVCASYVSSLTGACGAVIGSLVACEMSLGTAAELTEAATVICGSAEAGPSGEGGAGEGGASDGGTEDAASDASNEDGSASDSGAGDGGVSESGAADSSATDSGVADAGTSDAGDSGG